MYTLYALRDGKWHHWRDIYNNLPLEPKPKPNSYRRYLSRLHSIGHYYTKIVKEKGKFKEKRIYKKRRYVLKRKHKKKVYYRISPSGFRILNKMLESFTLKQVRHWRL